MEFEQVAFNAEMLIERDYKTEKQLMRSVALLAWLQGYGPKKTYPDFINSLGLGDNKIYSKDDRQRDIEKSKAVIEKISKMKKVKND